MAPLNFAPASHRLMPEKLASASRDIAPQSEDIEPFAPSVYAGEHAAARRAGVRWRRISRWAGLAIFVLGVALLFYVFWQALAALKQFSQPDYLNLQVNRIQDSPGEGMLDAPGNTVKVLQATLVVFGQEFLRVLYLLLLGFIASALAARGIGFFAASESVIDEAVVSEE